MQVAVEAAAGATADTIVAVVETAAPAPAAPAAPAKKRGATTGTPKAGAKKKQKNADN